MSEPNGYVTVIRRTGDISTGRIVKRLADGWVLIDDGGVRFKAEAIVAYKQSEQDWAVTPSLGDSK